MPQEPTIGGLSKTRRAQLFWLLALVFVAALPSLIFYTTGYRLSFEDDSRTIVTTGGMYVTTDNLEVDVYLDEEQVERPRLFRSAYYIQNIEAGQHRIVVQQPGLHTWVKELPVYPYIVTEAAAFNMPDVPHLRPITDYETATGTQIYVGTEIDALLADATTTVPFVQLPATSSRVHQLNEEYLFVQSLFSTSTEANRSVFDRLFDGVGRFGFATTSVETSTSSETDVVQTGDLHLVTSRDDVYAVWVGTRESIPHYYCVPMADTASTAARYGDHVALSFTEVTPVASSTVYMDDDRMCRTAIKLNRKAQDVYFYDFYPNSADLILLQLEDGLYVTEVDDRSWQNTQRVYEGADFQTIVANNTIYIKDGQYYFELVTEIETN